MSSDDPSLCSTRTLLESMGRDFGESQEHMRLFYRFFQASQCTLHELLRRFDREFPMRYKPHKAGPKPEAGFKGRTVRHFICADCDCIPDCPMLEDEVWYKFADKTTLLCVSCAEKRLGRQIDITDLRDCPGNAFTFLIHDRLLTRAKEFMIEPP